MYMLRMVMCMLAACRGQPAVNMPEAIFVQYAVVQIPVRSLSRVLPQRLSQCGSSSSAMRWAVNQASAPMQQLQAPPVNLGVSNLAHFCT